ncbi:MAG TPA: DUF1207 domain-containing protein [Vicinamibacterales bacterium]
MDTVRVFRGSVLLVLVALAIWPAPAAGQVFRDYDWFEPLVAEQRAARIAVNFGGTDAFEFSIEPGRRFVWDIHLGRELPMIAYVAAENPGMFRTGEWGVGLWAPVGFHMIEDFKDASNPIINTDYRFGTMLKFRYALAQERWIQARFVPWAHESTHLGDEFSLTAQQTFPQFERINVSYEYWEYSVGLETPRWSVRHGGLRPWGKDGYYSDHLLEPSGRQIPTSHSNFEPSFGGEYRHPHGDGSWSPFVSAEARHRILYDYRKPSSSTPEERQWSTTLAAGIRTAPASHTPATMALSEIYVRFYHGVNPHGQLRNQRDYTMFGVGFNFRVK